VFIVPGARSLKDRRQVVRSLQDRMRHKFHITCHVVDNSDTPGRQTLVITTAGNNRRVIETIFSKVRAFLEGFRGGWPGTIDEDIFSWHPTFVGLDQGEQQDE